MRRGFAFAVAGALLASLLLVAPGATAQDTALTRVIVTFEHATSSAVRSATLTLNGAKKVEDIYGLSDSLVVQSTRGESASQLAARLKSAATVVRAEVDKPLHISVANPNDPSFGSQYALQKINAVAGWTSYPGTYTSTGGAEIAMIDTGIDTTHPEFAGRIDTANSKCFGSLCFVTGYKDDNGHGSHTAGSAAASTNNGVGVAGVSYNSKIMVIKVCNRLGTCQTADIVSGINWARTHGAKVISMSLGGGGTATLQTAVQQAYNAGVTVVAAAGNDGNSNINYPAGYAQVISVAATDANDAHASFSNTNADVEVSAPGVDVYSTYSSGGYSTLSGTSMSTPHVAGLAALLKGQNPSWTPAQITNRIDSCSDDLGSPGRDVTFGFGRINLGRALGAC